MSEITAVFAIFGFIGLFVIVGVFAVNKTAHPSGGRPFDTKPYWGWLALWLTVFGPAMFRVWIRVVFE